MKSPIKAVFLILVLASTLSAIPGAQAAGPAVKVLHSFSSQGANLSNSDGADAEGQLVLSGTTLYGTTFSGGPNSNGTLFAVSTSGSGSGATAAGFKLLHSFGGYMSDTTINGDGAAPMSGMVLSGSTLYGTTAEGGPAGDGTVFSMNTDGSGFTLVHAFTNGPDGVNPFGGVIISGSTLYGTAWSGGAQGGGGVYALTTDGVFTPLYNFTGGSDGDDPSGALLLSNNRLYGTTSEGANGEGTVFGVNTDGTSFTVLHTFSDTDDGGANSDGAAPLAGLVLSGNTLYGTTTGGGTTGSGTIFAVNTDGSNFKTLYTFTSLVTGLGTNKDGASPFCTLALSGSTLYGTTHDGGDYSGTVFSVNTSGSGFTTLFAFPATAADGYSPYAGVVLSGSSLYGTTTGGGGLGVGGGTVFSLTGAGINGGTTPPPPKTVLVSATTSPAHTGTVSGGGSYQTGDSVTLTADDTNGCYQFTRWIVAGKTVSSNAAYPFTVTGAVAAVANFSEIEYTIQTSSDPSQGGTVTGGGKKPCGSEVVLTAVPKPGFKFVSWTSNDTTLLVGSPLKFPAANATITANFTSDLPPKLTVTSPISGSTTTNGITTLAGKASDSVGVAAVYYQLNSSGTWTIASSSNVWTNWSATITLTPGANTMKVYAVDNDNNTNPAVTVKVTYNEPASIVPQTLSGLVATAIDDATGKTNQISFGTSTAIGIPSDTNSAPQVGDYTFTPTGPKTGDLVIIDFAPPSQAGSGTIATLTFTSQTSAAYVGADRSTGTVTFKGAPDVAPDSFSGLAVQVNQRQSGPLTNFFADREFTNTDAMGFGYGTYTYVRYSPDAGVIEQIYTDPIDAPLTNYMFVGFSQSKNGVYSVESYHYSGPLLDVGTFSILETATRTETAPASLDGLAATITPVTPAGPSWTVNFGPATFGTSTFGNTNVPIGVGNYVYTRTGPTTATLVESYVNPPTAAAAGPVAITLTFSTREKAAFDSPDGSGTITLGSPHNVAPVTLDGTTVNSKTTTGVKTTDAYGAGTFSGTDGAGIYTYTIYAPGVTMGEGSLAGGSEGTNYVVTSYTTANSGSFYTTHISASGVASVYTGTFTSAPTPK